MTGPLPQELHMLGDISTTLWSNTYLSFLISRYALMNARNLVAVGSMNKETSRELRREWIALDQVRIYSILRDMKLPTVAMRDHIRATLVHKQYLQLSQTDGTLPIISKPCFLYLLICSRANRSANLYMRDYGYFGSDSVNLSKISYRDFTQAFVESDSDSGVISNVYPHYEAKFMSILHFAYPTSLRGILDKIPLLSTKDYVLLSEADIVYVKSSPTVMDDSTVSHKPPDENCMYAELLDSIIKADNSSMLLTSSTLDSHRDLLNMFRGFVPILSVESICSEHLFSFPHREIHYSQISEWLQRKNIKHSKSDLSQHIVAEGFMDGSRYEFMNVTLDINRCYKRGRSEAYRVKGDIVFQILIHSSRDKTYVESTLQNVYRELDSSICDVYLNPLELGVTNIAKLRATNSTVFDSLYCRKAPPIVQPLIIQESQIQESLAQGKMILRYQGILYTTRDKEQSRGQNYIGMINRFGDYDPSRPYIPIIRTYKTNHLTSRNFKEFKAYLLRHSIHPNAGYISKSDLVLPPHLTHLYRKRIVNPDPRLENIHSKKTIIANANKVSTGEVPDSVKSLLGTSGVRRQIETHKGTGLLELCNITKEHLLIYVLHNREKYPDLISLTIEDIEQDILSCNIDHRLYGRAIEDITGYCLIVFSMDGVVPYRFSMCEASGCMLLFLSPSGQYDRIIINIHNRTKYNVKYLKGLTNVAATKSLGSLESQSGRKVDYMQVYLRLLGYLHHTCNELKLRIYYSYIGEHIVPGIVEQIYSKVIYYESYVKVSEILFPKDNIFSRGQQCKIIVTKEHIADTFSPMIDKIDDTVLILHSPIDMSKYNKWNFLLEDCLYFSLDCYNLRDKEELQQTSRHS